VASIMLLGWLSRDGWRLHCTLCKWQLTIAKSDRRAGTDGRTNSRPMGAPFLGIEELPSDGRTNGGPSCHNRTLPYHPASDLHSDLPVYLAGGVSTPFAASARVSYVGHSWRSYPDVVRRTNIDETLSGIHSIRGHNQADDSLRVLVSCIVLNSYIRAQLLKVRLQYEHDIQPTTLDVSVGSIIPV